MKLAQTTYKPNDHSWFIELLFSLAGGTNIFSVEIRSYHELPSRQRHQRMDQAIMVLNGSDISIAADQWVLELLTFETFIFGVTQLMLVFFR